MKLGPYELLSEIGRGGMGVVYRVRGPDGREAALKVLLEADPETCARFERERRLLGSLGEEQGFVPLLDAGVSGETAWLAMPFLPGGTLRGKLEAGPLGVEETVALGLALARALGSAHERGIVHRDVKPENVLFAASGRPLLADLGLAKHFDPVAKGGSQSVSLTAHGTLKGTAGYMAPEQIEDAASAGPRADVFALGAVLHECLAGRPAFPGETMLEVLANLSSGTPGPIGRSDVPGGSKPSSAGRSRPTSARASRTEPVSPRPSAAPQRRPGPAVPSSVRSSSASSWAPPSSRRACSSPPGRRRGPGRRRRDCRRTVRRRRRSSAPPRRRSSWRPPVRRARAATGTARSPTPRERSSSTPGSPRPGRTAADREA